MLCYSVGNKSFFLNLLHALFRTLFSRIIFHQFFPSSFAPAIFLLSRITDERKSSTAMGDRDEEEDPLHIGTYEGERDDSGQRSGLGHVEFKNGDTYEGMYLKGRGCLKGSI
jgi:hypothetical protein